jgi:cyclic pyranopterin phosphate synthase
MGLIDRQGRRINYLRLSVTDRCNMRCRYCMPAAGVPKLEHGDILSLEDLHRVARAAVSVGIEKIRVTGGEPLVRRGILGLLAGLAEIPGLKQLVMTTNGLLLDKMAGDLHAAGVQRLNISLDSLRPETFAAVTRGADLERVLAGIAAAEWAGFPIKINVVAMRGINDAEILDFAALTLEKPYAVRFIEYMPTMKSSNWQQKVIPGEEILARIAGRFPFRPILPNELAGPARIFRIDGAAGTLGVITPVSGHFCQSCNRIRVTSSGMARSCLFSGTGLDLRPFLRKGDGEIAEAMQRVVGMKPDRHGITGPEADHEPFAMSNIGG